MSLSSGNHEIYVEFKEASVHLLYGERTLELELTRDAAGRIGTPAANQLAQPIRDFIQASGAATSLAYCSIPARGVSVRRLSIPAAPAEEAQRLLAMQLEAQLPVAPSELAWGSMPLARNKAATDGSNALQDFLVVAVKRDVLEDYRRVLSAAGLQAEFTVAALARQALCQNAASPFAIVAAGRNRSEVAAFDERGPTALRVLPWGVELNGETPASTLQSRPGERLYLLEEGRGQEALARALSSQLPGGTSLELVDARSRSTPGNEGVKRLLQSGLRPVLLGAHERLQPPPPSGKVKWLVLALALGLAALVLRYAESMVNQARLSRKLSQIVTYRNSLPPIEREYNFLNYIKTNQPPYLDTIAVLAQAAPAGTRIDSLSLLRHGDLTLRGIVGDAQAPGAFRSKLIDSGFFSRVVLDEQTPSADGQKFTFRISAQVKADGYRKPLAIVDAKPAPKPAVTQVAAPQ